MPISPTAILILIVLLYLVSSVKILAEYERGVIFRLGKLLPVPKGPGVALVFGCGSYGLLVGNLDRQLGSGPSSMAGAPV